MGNNLSKEQKEMADEIAERLIDIVGKPIPVQKLRNSQFFTAIFGAAGLALFLVGVEKVFADLSGWMSIGLGIILLMISGAFFSKLK